MLHRYFPRCPVAGPVEPAVPFAHMASHGAVPKKCSECSCLFEGECIRFGEAVNHYLHLDHGPCGIPGATDPVSHEDAPSSAKAQIPRKCANCEFLDFDSIREFYCTKDREKWGDFPRGLDWGDWQPEYLDLQLPLPKVTTSRMSRCAFQNDMMEFIREHRRVNPGLSIEVAKADYAWFRAIYEQS